MGWAHGFAEMTPSGARWTRKVALIPEKLPEPLTWREPRKVFVNSTSDLFHEELPFEHIGAVFGVMALARRHTFQILTKRTARALEFCAWLASNPILRGDTAETAERLDLGPSASAIALLRSILTDDLVRGPLFAAFLMGGIEPGPNAPIRKSWPLPNVWLGTSVEDQETALTRIDQLIKCPAAVRFVSYEPALGSVNFGRWLPGNEGIVDQQTGEFFPKPRLHWVIVGGESGPGARPFEVEWARSTVQQCKAAGVPVFVKQLGACPTWNGCSGPGEHWPSGTKKEDGRGFWKIHLKDKKGGDPEEWPEDLRVREFPEVHRG